MSSMDQGKHKPLELPKNREEFVRRMFEADDGCVSVGGLAHRVGMLRGQREESPRLPLVEGHKGSEFDTRRVALAKFVEFSRRQRSLSVEAFAAKAAVDPAEVLQAEDEDAPSPEPRAIFAIAAFLRADASKLMELAGHVTPRDENLGKEAVRFAAWSHGSAPLSEEEQRILCEFARVVVQASERS
jgi:transcriptional regulator with XRE-family HTH domain